MAEDRIISEGETWSIEDVLDDRTIASFSSWDTFNPEERAVEFFADYGRHCRLVRVKVVKYEREIVNVKGGPRSAGATSSDALPGGES